MLTAGLLVVGLGVAVAPTAAAVDGDLSFVAAASSAGNRTNHSVVVPGAVQAGDVLVLSITTNTTNRTVDDSLAGWTLAESTDGNRTRGRLWTRTATAGDAGSTVTVSASGATKAVLSLAAYRSTLGVPSVSATASTTVESSATSHDTPEVDVAGPGSWLVSLWSAKTSSTPAWTLPAEATQRVQDAAPGNGKITAVLGDSDGPVATGTAASRTATTSTTVNKGVMFSVVVRPGNDETPPDNTAPQAAFTSSCAALVCSFDASGSDDADGDVLTYAWDFGDGQNGSGETTSHTYGSAGQRTVTLTVDDGTDTDQATGTVNPSEPAGGPGHTTLPPDSARTDVIRIGNGEIFDLEAIGDTIYVAGSFTSIRNNAPGNTTSFNQPYLAAFNIDTGLLDTRFRPVFPSQVTDVEATPDGTKLYAAGRFNTVNGVTKRKFVRLNPITGATVNAFQANANSAGTELEATNDTVYLGGQYSTINNVPRAGLAAVDAVTGQVDPDFVNDVTGGIGPNGSLNIQELKLTSDESKLLVVHTGRQIAGQDRYGMGFIDTVTKQLLPWRTRLWDDNLQRVGGIQRIYVGDIAPNDSYFVVGSGSGGDRPPINDTAVALPVEGGDHVEPLWVSRLFDSIYGIAIAENAVYLGGHFNWVESQTSPDPWPGLDDKGYGWGQGLSGYALGDSVLRRDHVGAIDPVEGKALDWNPGSNSFEGNKAFLVHPRGVVTGGDALTQGGANIGRIAVYDFESVPPAGANETTISTPVEGRVVPSGEEFLFTGTAEAASGVQEVRLEIIDSAGNRYLQDDLSTWGNWNGIAADLESPGGTSTNWSLPVTIEGNRVLTVKARTFASNGSRDSTKDQNRFESFGTDDQTPSTRITAPSGILSSTTFLLEGTATDDVGINALTLRVRDGNNNYLQDDGTASADFNSFSFLPDVVGAPDATWSYEITVPYEGEWKAQVTAIDTAGQADLRSSDRTFQITESGVAPEVSINEPFAVTPPTSAPTLTLPPGSPLTFSGSATDDENLASVQIILRNRTTRENLAVDGTWGTDVNVGWYRVSPLNLNTANYQWSYTTPFDLTPGTYQFIVRAYDDDGLRTPSSMYGRLNINAEVEGDSPPDGLLDFTDTDSSIEDLHLDITGTATDDLGVASVGVALEERDSRLYLQPDGTLAAGFTTLPATVVDNPDATSVTFSLSVDLPRAGDYRITALAVDTAGQLDLSTSGATARYLVYPGDADPYLNLNLALPTEGNAFTESRIFVSGRAEDDNSIAEVDVAIVDSEGRYLSSSGTFGSTSESWRSAFLTSPTSPGSNYAYTSPAIPDGTYTVRVRAVDANDQEMDPSHDVTVTVTAPPGNAAPVAAFTVDCTENVCDFDGRSSTDENAPTLTYAWDFGNGSGTGPVRTRTYTEAATYTVSLVVTDEYGASSDPVTQDVTITEPPGNTAPVPVINPPSCIGLVCNISGVGSADPDEGDSISYLWDFGDGTETSTRSAMTHEFPAAGDYTVTLTTTDGWGNAASTTRLVSVTE